MRKTHSTLVDLFDCRESQELERYNELASS